MECNFCVTQKRGRVSIFLEKLGSFFISWKMRGNFDISEKREWISKFLNVSPGSAKVSGSHLLVDVHFQGIMVPTYAGASFKWNCYWYLSYLHFQGIMVPTYAGASFKWNCYLSYLHFLGIMVPIYTGASFIWYWYCVNNHVCIFRA